MDQLFQNLYCLPHNNSCVALSLDEECNLVNKVLCSVCIEPLQDNSEKFITLNQLLSNIKTSQKIAKQNPLLFCSLMDSLLLIDSCQLLLKNISQSINSFLYKFKNPLEIEQTNADEIYELLKQRDLLSQYDVTYQFEFSKELLLTFLNNKGMTLKNTIESLQTIFESKAYQQDVSLIHNYTEINEFDNQQYVEQLLEELGQKFDLKLEQQKQLREQQLNSEKHQDFLNLNTYETIINFKQQRKIYCLELSNDNNLIAAGCFKDILILITQNGEMNVQSTLTGHTNWITILKFNQKNCRLYSGSQDKSIKVWIQYAQNWKSLYTFEQSNAPINYILLNKNEDQIISTTNDSSIQIWDICGNQKQKLQDQLNNQNTYQLDYNSNESQLISRSSNFLSIWSLDETSNLWQQKQVINNLNDGNYVCFINDQLIATQDNTNSEILLFHQNKENGIFEQYRTVSLGNLVENYFPYFCLSYNKDKQQLFARSTHFIHIIQIDYQNDKFELFDTIECEKIFVGTFSNNFQHLIIYQWDKQIISVYEQNKQN